MLDEICNCALGISKIDEEAMCEFQFSFSFLNISYKLQKCKNPRRFPWDSEKYFPWGSYIRILEFLSFFYHRIFHKIKNLENLGLLTILTILEKNPKYFFWILFLENSTIILTILYCQFYKIFICK